MGEYSTSRPVHEALCRGYFFKDGTIGYTLQNVFKEATGIPEIRDMTPDDISRVLPRIHRELLGVGTPQEFDIEEILEDVISGNPEFSELAAFFKTFHENQERFLQKFDARLPSVIMKTAIDATIAEAIMGDNGQAILVLDFIQNLACDPVLSPTIMGIFTLTDPGSVIGQQFREALQVAEARKLQLEAPGAGGLLDVWQRDIVVKLEM